jgi:general secretion pathway protein H
LIHDGQPRLRQRGFTLLELLVVLAIVAIGSAGVGFAMRDGTQNQLEREALRLSALLESARARSQLSGVPVRWRTTAQGFEFDGLSVQAGSEAALPQTWLDADIRALVDVGPSVGANAGINARISGQAAALLLGPEPIIPPQSVTLTSRSQPDKRLRLGTDGVRPFAVQVGP